MFSNGERHRRQKRFLITISKFMQVKHLLPAIMDIMPEHLVKWNFKQGIIVFYYYLLHRYECFTEK